MVVGIRAKWIEEMAKASDETFPNHFLNMLFDESIKTKLEAHRKKTLTGDPYSLGLNRRF